VYLFSSDRPLLFCVCEITVSQEFFRKWKSTCDALYSFSKTIVESINNNKKILLLFIDLAKAFDSINRDILFKKLEHIGVRGVALNWFESYLSQRKQIVSINNYLSDVSNIDYGVVQGSSLGPLLFVIYINNISKINLFGSLYLFADDTAVIFQHDTWQQVFSLASRELTIIKRWFDENVLTMNISKTKCLPVALRPSSEPPADLNVVLHSCDGQTPCDCTAIERVHTYQYLGVVFDSKLKWNFHIQSVKSKVRKMIYAFYQLNHILDFSQLKTVYFSYVQSVIQYGILIWGGANNSVIEPLYVVQKLIIKAAFRINRRYSTVLLFKDTNLLSLKQIFIKTLLIYIYLNKDKIINPVVHGYRTRNAANVGAQVPLVVKSCNFTNALYLGNFLYRNIPPHIRNLFNDVPLTVFKKRVTGWLVEIGIEESAALLSAPYR
jgi:hypothetical protein